ncbi:MAG: ThiF family adenylyltransferase [Hyphomicrobiaceae bacterium]
MTQATSLEPDEIARYQRHLVLREVGGAGQQRLKAARVLLVGAGGLGSPVALYLAAAGVGRLTIVDDDHVSLSNLQRQIAHSTNSVGMRKVDSAAMSVGALNPHVEVMAIAERIRADNACDLITAHDLVIDGSDNFATRYLVSDACHLARRPLVFGAVGPFDGYVTTFRSHESGADGTPNPTYRCLFPSAPHADAVFNCAEVGVLGAVVGVIGTLQATEALKEIIGIGEGLVGRLLTYDALSARFATMRYAWDDENPLSGRNARWKDLTHHVG